MTLFIILIPELTTFKRKNMTLFIILITKLETFIISYSTYSLRMYEIEHVSYICYITV